MGTLGGFPNPPALWLRRAKLASANAVLGTLGGFPSPSAPANPPCQRGRRDQKALDSPLALDELKQRAALVAHALLQLGVTPPLLPKFLGDLQGGQDGERLGVSGASLLLQIAQVFVDVGGHLAHHAFILVAAQGETMTGNADTDWALHAIPRTSTLPSAGPRVSPVPRAELGFAARVGVSTTGQRGQPQGRQHHAVFKADVDELDPHAADVGRVVDPANFATQFQRPIPPRNVEPDPYGFARAVKIVRAEEETVCAHIGHHTLDDLAVADVLGRDLHLHTGGSPQLSCFLRIWQHGWESPGIEQTFNCIGGRVNFCKINPTLFACAGQSLHSALRHKRSKRHPCWRQHAKDFFLTKVATRATTPARPSGRSLLIAFFAHPGP